jgi:hypothetical protein
MLGRMGARDTVRTIAGAVFPRRVTARASIWIARARDDVYPLLADFETGWTQWSPYGSARDPTVVLTYDGPRQGVGAVQRWTSKRMGTGSMRMIRADPASGVGYVLSLEFLGAAVHGEAALDFTPTSDGSTVTWSSTMDLSSSRLLRTLGRVVRAGMRDAFAQGLAALKNAAERESAPHDGDGARPSAS